MSRNAGTLGPFAARIPFIDWSAASFADALSRRASAALCRWKKRRTIRALERLDDWVLNDIGLSRGEIPRFVDDLVADDPRPASLARTVGSSKPDDGPKG
jgi:uncharacterized protein YjiS (DUF1127 family)